MKRSTSTFNLVCLILCFFYPISQAIGTEIVMEDARIEKVVHDHRGIVLTVTGTVKLFVPKVEGDAPEGGNAKWITLPMASGEIRYLGGELYAPSADGNDAYLKRLKAMEGTNQLLQIWGSEATVAGGHITHVTARVVGVLLPREGERRFDYGKLEELSEADDKPEEPVAE